MYRETYSKLAAVKNTPQAKKDAELQAEWLRRNRPTTCVDSNGSTGSDDSLDLVLKATAIYAVMDSPSESCSSSSSSSSSSSDSGSSSSSSD